jgi:cardiolipin synthase
MKFSMDRLLRYKRQRRRLRKGCGVVVLRDGKESYPAMLEAIASAKHFIFIEFYIWRGDQTGWRFADALMERSRNGVQVRAVFDGFGCLDVDPLIFDTMRLSGIEVIEYRPLAPWRPNWGLFRRNHRKILVVDNRIGFVGGINLADVYASVGHGGEGWRDNCVRLEGPVVRDISRLFLNTWNQLTDAAAAVELPELELPATAGDKQVAILANNEFSQRFRIRRSYIHAINRAERTIRLANAYFLPDRNIRRALYRAARRGVEVKIMLPSKSDVPFIGWATCHLYARFLRRGIRLFEWTRSMFHSKTATIDEVWSTVGSYNLDHKSLRHNLEVNCVVVDPEVGLEMANAFDEDTMLCTEITVREWKQRSWPSRLRSWFFYQWRKLM